MHVLITFDLYLINVYVYYFSRCSVCNEPLTGWDFEKDGVFYCDKDYYNKFGERCRHCENFMSGPVMVVGGEIKFHPECFKCDSCSSIIGDDESYAYVKRSKLYCNQCLQKQAPQVSPHLDSLVRFQHSYVDNGSLTQIIEIAPRANGKQRHIEVELRDNHFSINPTNSDNNHKG